MKFTSALVSFLSFGAVAWAQPQALQVSPEQDAITQTLNNALGPIKGSVHNILTNIDAVNSSTSKEEGQGAIDSIRTNFVDLNQALQQAIDSIESNPKVTARTGGGEDNKCTLCSPLTDIINLVFEGATGWVKLAIHVFKIWEEDAKIIIRDALKSVYLAFKLTVVIIKKAIVVIPTSIIKLFVKLGGEFLKLIGSSKVIIDCIKEVGAAIYTDLTGIIGELFKGFPIVGDLFKFALDIFKKIIHKD